MFLGTKMAILAAIQLLIAGAANAFEIRVGELDSTHPAVSTVTLVTGDDGMPKVRTTFADGPNNSFHRVCYTIHWNHSAGSGLKKDTALPCTAPKELRPLFERGYIQYGVYDKFQYEGRYTFIMYYFDASGEKSTANSSWTIFVGSDENHLSDLMRLGKIK